MDKCGNAIASVLTEAIAGTREWWKRNPGDYINEEGELVCGKCGVEKQYKMSLSDPTEEEPNRKIEKLVPCACKCDKEEFLREKESQKIEKLKKRSNMGDKYIDALFETYKITEHNQRNYRYAKHYAECFERMLEKNQGLVFWGNVGTGKSYTAACIANNLLEKGYKVVFSSFVEILENIGRHYDDYSYIDDLINAQLLILDDLGAERDTRYAKEKVYNIINSRIDRNLPIVLTTNLTLQEMQSEENTESCRIYDRVLGCCYPMQFTGPSWRMKSAYERFNEMEKLFNV